VIYINLHQKQEKQEKYHQDVDAVHEFHLDVD
jgi:hypothetical protein